MGITNSGTNSGEIPGKIPGTPYLIPLLFWLGPATSGADDAVEEAGPWAWSSLAVYRFDSLFIPGRYRLARDARRR
jgi:hypothetical protein